MAIAFDNSSIGTGSGTTVTFSHTVAGSNTILFVGVCSRNTGFVQSADVVTGVTYNGVAMTQITKVNVQVYEYIYLFYLLAPAAGTNSIIVSRGAPVSGGINLIGLSSSYTGVQQSGQPDSSNTNGTGGFTTSVGLTTVANNCWVVGIGSFYQDTGTTANSSGTIRQHSGSATLADSNSPISPAGSTTMDFNNPGSNGGGESIAASFSPLPLTSHGSFLLNLL